MEYLSQEQIQAMPVADRLDLIEKLWLSIEHDPDAFTLTDEQKREIDRRIVEMETEPSVSWEEMHARLRQLAGAEA